MGAWVGTGAGWGGCMGGWGTDWLGGRGASGGRSRSVPLTSVSLARSVHSDPDSTFAPQTPEPRERGTEIELEFQFLLRAVFSRQRPARPLGWLHFHPRQKRNQWFTFATHARMSRGGPSPRSRALIHISAKPSRHTVGGTACREGLAAIWSCDPRR